MIHNTFLENRFYCELAGWREDQQLLDAADECIELQRRLAATQLEAFVPDSSVGEVVSENRLRGILRAGGDIHGIATRRDISNVIVFNARHIDAAVMSRKVAALRRGVDRLVASKLREQFRESRLMVHNSGHFWYPPGGYMSWHTNSGDPGWRLYLTYTEQPGSSFFRYRDPSTDEVVTSFDHQWDFRMFKVSREMPLWHSVYSDTHRFSLGFVIRPWSMRNFAGSKIRRVRKLMGTTRWSITSPHLTPTEIGSTDA